MTNNQTLGQEQENVKSAFKTFIIDKIKPYRLDNLKKAFSRLPRATSLRQLVPSIFNSENHLLRENPFINILQKQSALKISQIVIKENLEMQFLKNLEGQAIKFQTYKLGKQIPIQMSFNKADLNEILNNQSQLLRKVIKEQQEELKRNNKK